MESEGRPGPPLMLKEWLELEDSAELSHDGFGCYPRHLGGELRNGSGKRRNGDVIARVSSAVRAALFPPSGREGEGEGEVALSKHSSRRPRVRFWKKRSWEREEVASGVSSSSASARRDGSSPSTSLRRRSWKIGQARGVGAGAAGCRGHETEVPGLEATCHLEPEQEQEQKQRRSPVSVMDFLSQDEDDGDDEGGDGYGEDDEVASPAYQRSLENIRRASQQLLQKIRQLEQLAELEISDDVDGGATATEDTSCHVAEPNYVEDGEGAPVQTLLDLLGASSPGSTHHFQKLVENFFCGGLKKLDGPGRVKPLLETAKTWSDGQDRRLVPREIEWLGRWSYFGEDEVELLAVDLESEIFWSLVEELVDL